MKQDFYYVFVLGLDAFECLSNEEELKEYVYELIKGEECDPSDIYIIRGRRLQINANQPVELKINIEEVE